jgi:hypothetical protein
MAVEAKVKLSLRLTKHHAMRMYGVSPRTYTGYKPRSSDTFRRLLSSLSEILRGFAQFPQTNTWMKGKGKGKIVPVIFLTEHHAMKAYWGVEV